MLSAWGVTILHPGLQASNLPNATQRLETEPRVGLRSEREIRNVISTMQKTTREIATTIEHLSAVAPEPSTNPQPESNAEEQLRNLSRSSLCQKIAELRQSTTTPWQVLHPGTEVREGDSLERVISRATLRYALEPLPLLAASLEVLQMIVDLPINFEPSDRQRFVEAVEHYGNALEDLRDALDSFYDRPLPSTKTHESVRERGPCL